MESWSYSLPKLRFASRYFWNESGAFSPSWLFFRETSTDTQKMVGRFKASIETERIVRTLVILLLLKFDIWLGQYWSCLREVCEIGSSRNRQYDASFLRKKVLSLLSEGYREVIWSITIAFGDAVKVTITSGHYAIHLTIHLAKLRKVTVNDWCQTKIRIAFKRSQDGFISWWFFFLFILWNQTSLISYHSPHFEFCVNIMNE